MRTFPLLLGSCLAFGMLAGCGDSCFVRGTRIATTDGDRPIEDIAIGDTVLAYSHAERTVVTRRVVAVHRSTVREIRTVTVVAAGQDERRLCASPSHPFWVEARGGYVAIRDLRVGDVLLLRTSAGFCEAQVHSITAQERAEPAFEVFNISVETPESNYFAEGVLVHNKEPATTTCDSIDIATPATKVADEGTNAARYQVDVSLPRPGTLRVTAYGGPKGASKADQPLDAHTTDSGDGKRWKIEVVVHDDMRAILVIQVDSTTGDNASCSYFKTVDIP